MTKHINFWPNLSLQSALDHYGEIIFALLKQLTMIFFFYFDLFNLSEADQDIIAIVTNGTMPPVNGAHNATEILQKLFRNYDKRLRPDYAGKGHLKLMTL